MKPPLIHQAGAEKLEIDLTFDRIRRRSIVQPFEQNALRAIKGVQRLPERQHSMLRREAVALELRPS